MRLRKISLLIMTMCLLSACGSTEPTGTNNVVVETETQIIGTETEQVIEIEETELINIEIVETLDTVMYVIKDGSIYTGDGTDYDVLDTLVINVEAHVTGKTANGWYEIDCGTVKGYVPADSLSIEDPNPSKEFTEEEQKQSDENNAIFEQMKQQFDEEAIQESPTEDDGDDYEGGRDLSKIDW